MTVLKPKLLFIYDLHPDLSTQDGLHAALEVMRNEFDITKVNLKVETPKVEGYDFVLGHGAWSSSVDNFIKSNSSMIEHCGLCIGGNIKEPDGMMVYDILFCETDWYLPKIKSHANPKVAFGVNTDVFYEIDDMRAIFDYLGVGSFAKWKRWEYFIEKKGVRMIVGEVQQNNLPESLGIIAALNSLGVGTMPNVSPKDLNLFYNNSAKVYIPATDYGGGERAIWEAKACGCKVECAPDNKKLQELIEKPYKSHKDYAKVLLDGILNVIL